MTFTLLILAATFLAATWIAIDLLRSGHGSGRRAGAPGSSSRGNAFYKPVGRLLKDVDFDYIGSHEDLKSQLRASRRTAMRLYMREIRVDFLEVWQVCRLLAPISPDPAYVSQLSRQYWSFHWAYLNVQAQCLLPATVRPTVAADGLVDALNAVRDQARSLLAVSDSALVLPTAA